MRNPKSCFCNPLTRTLWILSFFLPGMAAGQDLEFVEALFDGVDAGEIAGPRFAAVSPDGGNVYVASENDNAVTVFDRDPATGALTFLGAEVDGIDGVDGLAGADAVAVSPDGSNVYSASAAEAAVAVFERQGDGTLDFLEAQFNGGPITGLSSTVWITISPDGNHVIASGFSDDSIVVFTRNPDGTLTYLETETEGVGGVTGLNGAFGTAVSPDGAHVYAAGLISGAVALFDRNPDGSLDFVEAVVDGAGGVDGIAGARTVTVSGDGRNVYVAGLFDSAVAAFERDPTSGELTFIEAELNGVGGVEGINFASSAFLDPGGSHLVASGFGDSALAVFERDATSGEITFRSAVFDGVAGVAGLAGVVFADVSPDGQNVYATGFDGNSLAVFRFPVEVPVIEIPTLSPWGIAALGLVLGFLGLRTLGRRAAARVSPG